MLFFCDAFIYYCVRDILVWKLSGIQTKNKNIVAAMGGKVSIHNFFKKVVFDFFFWTC